MEADDAALLELFARQPRDRDRHILKVFVDLAQLIENMTLGHNAVGYLTESLHGAGSPQAQRIQTLRQMEVEAKKGLAENLAGIEPVRE